jgi:hypothetical protein
MKYFLAKVKFQIDTDGDKPKFKTRQFLVKDESVSAVEARLYQEFDGSTEEWTVESVVSTQIEDVLEPIGVKA